MRIGTRVQVQKYTSGINSGKRGVVVANVPWRNVPGMYQPPGKDEVCILLDEGQRHSSFGRHIFMFKNRLEVIA